MRVAAHLGHAAVVKALLVAGAEKDQQTEDGRTAVMAAALGGHAAAVEALARAGANTDIQDEVRTAARCMQVVHAGGACRWMASQLSKLSSV